MRSLILSVATAVVLMTAVVTGALAADPPATEAPPQVEAPTPSPSATGPYDGTIVVDPTFVSGGALPTQRPRHPGAPNAAQLTPPPTDAGGVAAPTDGGAPIPVVLLVSSAVVALGALPRSTRRRRLRRA